MTHHLILILKVFLGFIQNFEERFSRQLNIGQICIIVPLYKTYYDKLAPKSNRGKHRREITPPQNAKFIFFGCGKTGSTTLDLGIIVTPSELFDPKSYGKTAKPVRNFFVYDSTGSNTPLGFSGSANIDLNSWDVDSRSDNDRVCFLTSKYQCYYKMY